MLENVKDFVSEKMEKVEDFISNHYYTILATAVVVPSVLAIRQYVKEMTLKGS